MKMQQDLFIKRTKAGINRPKIKVKQHQIGIKSSRLTNCVGHRLLDRNTTFLISEESHFSTNLKFKPIK
jgi:hypothetical protein